ncbi:hypothetical protein [Streptomyces sp. NPDC060002]|uniref:hypothetical protein n=1 Tax=Streptomyces sp. NPDC060002 TaxID=3347033 RepID=UPI0036953B59
MLDEAEGEGGPADAFSGSARREVSGNTFHAPAAIQQGDRGIQVNVFPDAPEDARHRDRWLAQYLAAAAETSKEHPYPAMLPSAGPSLDDVYVRQRLGSLAQDGLPFEGDAIDRILGSTQMCAVLAGAGGGKSSLLRTLLAVGVDRWRQDPGQGVVPVLVPAAALDGQALDTALAGAVRSGLKGLVETLPPALFLEPPTPRACWLVLVDELDEIADPIRRWRVLRHLRSVEENPDRPHYRFVIATRPLPESELDLLGPAVGRYELERFQLVELADVAHRWFSAYGLSDPGRLAQLFVGDLERSHLAGLARIPLMASLLCQLYAATPGQPLPAVRGQIYAEFARMLHKRQYNPAEPGNPRALCTGFRRYGDEAVTCAERTLGRLPQLIDFLAAERREGSTLRATEILGSHPDAAPPPPPHAVPPDEWQQFLATALRHSGLLTFHAGDHVFVHQTLLEYCAARHATSEPATSLLRRALARWHNADTSYLGFLIDLASPAAIRKAAPALRRTARLGGLEGCLFLAELARLGTALPDDVVSAATRGLTRAARNSRKTESDRTQAVVALTRIFDPRVRGTLRTLVQSGALHGSAVVAALTELRELGDPQVLDMLHDLAVSEAQDSGHRLWAARRLADHDDPRVPDTLYALAVSERARSAHRAAATEQLAGLLDPRVVDAYCAVAGGPGVSPLYRAAAAMEFATFQDDRLPGVLHALARDRNVEVFSRQWAARLLADSGDPGTAALLLELTHDPTIGEGFRWWATGQLSAHGYSDLSDVLFFLACDPSLDGHARVRAAWDLGRTGDPRGRRLLRALALEEPGTTATGVVRDEGSRAGAASALAALGSADAPDVFDKLARDGGRAHLDRRISVQQLADLKDSRAADALRSLAADTAVHVSIRTEAAFELADLNEPRAIGLLQSLVLDMTLDPRRRAFVVGRLCEHTDARVPSVLRDLGACATLDSLCRTRAIEGLARLRDPAVPELLFGIAADTGLAESARSLAAAQLMERHDDRAPHLLHRLATETALTPATRETAIAWLGHCGPRAHTLLRDLASSHELDSSLRYLAGRTLATQHVPEARTLLAALARDGSARPQDRAEAAQHLIEQGDSYGPGLLHSQAQDTSLDDEHRFDAAQNLAYTGDARGADLLHELALDPRINFFIRRSAARELARHEDPRLPALLRTLAEDPTLDGLSRFVAARRLVEAGDPDGPLILRRLAGDPSLDEEARAEAARELRSLAPPAEPLGPRILPPAPPPPAPPGKQS